MKRIVMRLKWEYIIHSCIHTNVHTRKYICEWVYIYIYIYIYIFTYIYIYIYIYIHTHTYTSIYMYIYGKRIALKPKKKSKDTIKYYLKQSGLSMDHWEEVASDRSKRQKLVHESIESFENSCMQYNVFKRLYSQRRTGSSTGPLKSPH